MKNVLLKEVYTIKDFPVSERPREKLERYGAESLSNSELLGIIIRTGNKDKTAIDLGTDILKLDKRGLSHLRDITMEELQTINGIGQTKAAQILASIEIGKRISYESAESRVRISSPMTVANLFMDEMRYLDKEYFNILLLDTKNQIITKEIISIGTLNASIVHPRDVFKVAIKKNANSIILLHNHPSGDPTPSSEDVNVTKRLIEVGELVGIKVLDHIVIGDNEYISMREKRII